jgi:hypothetical protein
MLCNARAKKLHEDRQSEMQQTLTQMNDRTEALDRLATQKEAASAAKADAEGKLEVGTFLWGTRGAELPPAGHTQFSRRKPGAFFLPCVVRVHEV